MKKIIVLASLAFLFFGCENQKKEETIKRDDTYGVTVFRHGNHQYIFVKHFNAGGLCHYEDCDYCKSTNKEYGLEKLQ